MFRNSFNSLIVREREGRPGASHACSEMPEQHAGGISSLNPNLVPVSHATQLSSVAASRGGWGWGGEQ